MYSRINFYLINHFSTELNYNVEGDYDTSVVLQRPLVDLILSFVHLRSKMGRH